MRTWLSLLLVAVFGVVWIAAALSIDAPFALVAAGVVVVLVGFGGVALAARWRRR